MPLLSEPDRQAVELRLASITQPVTLLFFTQTIGAPDSAFMTRQILDEVAGLSERLTVEEANLILDRERAAEYGIEQIPALVLLSNGKDTRIRFLGAPAGYEFMSLIDAIVMAGTGDSGLSITSRRLIAERVDKPLEVLVFVTPQCPHCPRAVTLAQRMALESPLIRATSVDAIEFVDLSHRFRVTGVPKTVVNGSVEVLGAVPEDAFVQQILPPAHTAPGTKATG
jgi:glutaredoxin-like protein